MKKYRPFLNDANMKVTNAQKIKLGVFVLLTALTLVVSLYFIGKKQNLLGNTFRITGVFNNISGLKLGNNVRYAGINVGTVRNIVMLNDTTICVDMVMQADILRHIRKNARAAVGSDGLVGSMVVNIFPVTGDAEPLQPGDTIMSIKKITANDMISTLNITNENAAELSQELLQITHSLNEGKGSLGLLLNDEKMGEDLKLTISNLRSASKNAAAMVDEIKSVISEIDKEESLFYVLLKDSVSAARFRNTIANLERSSEQIGTVLDGLSEVVDDVKTGEGTFNYLVSDTILVQDIQATVKNIREGSVMLNENLEAMRHNVLFRGYFKKQEKQQERES